MGTPQFLIGQTLLLVVWIALNGLVLRRGAIWDVYPFILLNLMLSFQAAYAAPFILVSSNRQGQRDALRADGDARHRQELADYQSALMERNFALTEQVHVLALELSTLTGEVHAHICAGGASTEAGAVTH